MISQVRRDVGTSVSYTCPTDHELTGGSSQRTCRANLTWSGSDPSCKDFTSLHQALLYHTSGILLLLFLFL